MTDLAFSGLFGTGLAFNVSREGIFLMGLSIGLYFVIGFYAMGYIKKEKRLPFLLILIASMASMAMTFFAGSLMTLFIGLELQVLFCYLLVRFDGSKEASYGANVYFCVSISAGAFVLLASGLLFLEIGEITFKALEEASEMIGNTREIAAFLLLMGFSAKMGLFPVHGWLPLAHPVAPAPASALLSGVIVKGGFFGAYVVLRALYPSGEVALVIINTLYIVAITSAFYGGIMSIVARQPKVILAYSTISNMGLLALGLIGYLMNPAGFNVAYYILIYISFHAVIKVLLFLTVGTVSKTFCYNKEQCSGEEQDLRGESSVRKEIRRSTEQDIKKEKDVGRGRSDQNNRYVKVLVLCSMIVGSIALAGIPLTPFDDSKKLFFSLLEYTSLPRVFNFTYLLNISKLFAIIYAFRYYFQTSRLLRSGDKNVIGDKGSLWWQGVALVFIIMLVIPGSIGLRALSYITTEELATVVALKGNPPIFKIQEIIYYLPILILAIGLFFILPSIKRFYLDNIKIVVFPDIVKNIVKNVVQNIANKYSSFKKRADIILTSKLNTVNLNFDGIVIATVLLLTIVFLFSRTVK